ncbi:coiled-coil domain-containing protein 106-like [Oryzias latipes]|uniref:coiled-coil domain-containing protein 106-like n=1 Tax=Oryzias latipes TaxID=8090 RepID=UPI000CE27CC6|nr:coiled-coil domain-containing protein 106-like [Oryzias latipes]
MYTRSGAGRAKSPELKKSMKRKQTDEARLPDQAEVSPTAQLVTKQQQQQIKKLTEKIQRQEELIKELSAEKDFLKEQLAKHPPQASTNDIMLHGKQQKTSQVQSSSSASTSSSSSDSSDSSCSNSSSDSSSESSSSDEEKKKKKKKKKKNGKKKKGTPKKKKKRGKSGKKRQIKARKHVRRARVPDEVVERYRKVLKAFNKGQTLTAAFRKVGVDRNTVVCSAAVAELAIAAPQKYSELKQFHNPKKKLSDFTKACIDTIDANSQIEDTINTFKKSGQLLPLGKGRY